MSKFNVGDRVRVIDWHSAEARITDDGMVVGVTPGGCVVRLDADAPGYKGVRWSFIDSKLELAPIKKTHTVTIPEDREVTGVETKEDHIRVNLKKKIEVGKWYRGTMTGRWGQVVGPSLVYGCTWKLCSLSGEKFDVIESMMEEIEPFEEILQVLDPKKDSPAEGDLVWDSYIGEWRRRGRSCPFLSSDSYARKRKVLKAELSGGQ